jgi:AraC-like DNA-binding protein
VLETVLETGYEVPFHCDRGFRHVAGISPREYRLHYQQHQVYIFPAGGIEKKPG